MLGVPNYQPHFFQEIEVFYQTSHAILKSLIGKTINRFWLMWDETESEWFSDAPVILDISGSRYEFCAFQLDQFSFTQNQIDITQQADWYGMKSDFPLSWRENCHAQMLSSLHRTIVEINILSYNFSLGKHQADQEKNFILHGIEFVLEKKHVKDEENHFTIYNALDENGLTNQAYLGKDFRKRSISK